jgi:hypothetical protein
VNRYNVIIEREVLVYAESDDEARGKALSYLMSVSGEVPATRPIKVTSVIMIPPLEGETGPEVNGVTAIREKPKGV